MATPRPPERGELVQYSCRAPRWDQVTVTQTGTHASSVALLTDSSTYKAIRKVQAPKVLASRDAGYRAVAPTPCPSRGPHAGRVTAVGFGGL